MPPVSQAQRRFFRWAAANPEESGVPKSVSHEFNVSDPGGKLPERKGKALGGQATATGLGQNAPSDPRRGSPGLSYLPGVYGPEFSDYIPRLPPERRQTGGQTRVDDILSLTPDQWAKLYRQMTSGDRPLPLETTPADPWYKAPSGSREPRIYYPPDTLRPFFHEHTGFAMRPEPSRLTPGYTDEQGRAVPGHIPWGYGIGEWDPALARPHTYLEDAVGYARNLPGAIASGIRDTRNPPTVTETARRAYANPLPVYNIGEWEQQTHPIANIPTTSSELSLPRDLFYPPAGSSVDQMQAGGTATISPEDQVQTSGEVFSGAAHAFGEDLANLVQGFYEAGPGTIQKAWEGQLPPGAPETKQAARQTALTYGALSPIKATGLGRASVGSDIAEQSAARADWHEMYPQLHYPESYASVEHLDPVADIHRDLGQPARSSGGYMMPWETRRGQPQPPVFEDLHTDPLLEQQPYEPLPGTDPLWEGRSGTWAPLEETYAELRANPRQSGETDEAYASRLRSLRGQEPLPESPSASYRRARAGLPPLPRPTPRRLMPKPDESLPVGEGFASGEEAWRAGLRPKGEYGSGYGGYYNREPATTQAPASVKLVKNPEMSVHDYPYGEQQWDEWNEHVLDILDPDGRYHGHMTVQQTRHPQTSEPMLYVSGMDSVGGPGYFTRQQVKSFARQLRQEFPDATSIKAQRVSGARAESGSGSTPGWVRLGGVALPQGGFGMPFFGPRQDWLEMEDQDIGRRWVGGGVGLGARPRLQFGGMGHMTSADMPFWTRAEARSIEDQPFGGGLIGSSGAGRTDQLPLALPVESHVIPAAEIAGLGQGNSLAGARILTAALSVGPWGIHPLPSVHGHGPPQAPPVRYTRPAGLGPEEPYVYRTQAGGSSGIGSEGGTKHETSILAAGGEFVVPREDWLQRNEHGQLILHAGVRTIGEGDISQGHKRLNEMIHNIRNHTIKVLKTAPPPKD